MISPFCDQRTQYGPTKDTQQGFFQVNSLWANSKNTKAKGFFLQNVNPQEEPFLLEDVGSFPSLFPRAQKKTHTPVRQFFHRRSAGEEVERQLPAALLVAGGHGDVERHLLGVSRCLGVSVLPEVFGLKEGGFSVLPEFCGFLRRVFGFGVNPSQRNKHLSLLVGLNGGWLVELLLSN